MISNKRQLQHHEVEQARTALALVGNADLVNPADIQLVADTARSLACIIIEAGPEPHHRKTDTYLVKEKLRRAAQDRLRAGRIATRAPVYPAQPPPVPKLGLGELIDATLSEVEGGPTEDIESQDIDAEADAFGDGEMP